MPDAPEAVHLEWILIPQELDLALGAPGGFEEFWRSDFWIRRGAPEVARLRSILILQELDLALEPQVGLRRSGGQISGSGKVLRKWSVQY